MAEIELGDVITIPFGKKYFAVAKILWVSQVFKDVIGFAVLPKLHSIHDIPEVQQDNYKSISIYSGDINVLYGDALNVSKGKWKTIGKLPVTENDKNLMLHNIGGDLYQGDSLIEELNDKSISDYPKFLNAGDEAIEQMLLIAFELN